MLLGYPDCCVSFYHKKAGASSDVDFLNAALRNSTGKGPFNFVSNVARCGKTVILHFPCSYQCEGSLRLGRAYFNCISSLDKHYADQCRQVLQNAVFIGKDFLVNFQEKQPRFDRAYENIGTKGIEAKRAVLVDETTIKINGKAHNGNLIYFNSAATALKTSEK